MDLTGLPGDLARSGAPVCDARQHEEQIGQAIQIDHHELRNVIRATKVNHAPLRAPTHGSRDVQRRGLWRAAGYDERLQRLELVFAIVDRALQLGDTIFIDTSLRELLTHLVGMRRREQRADGEQVALDRDEHLIDPWHHLDGARHSENGVQLIDVAVGFDARVVLADAAAPEEARVAGVAGLGVDLRRHARKVAMPNGFRPLVTDRLFFHRMTTHDLTDITIIGGGPTGLFAQFYAGMRKATSRIIDALPELGGQLKALYPEKLIFDVGGFPRVLAKDLVNPLAAQAGQFGAKSYLGERVVGLTEENGHFVVVTETQRFPTRAVVIAGGIGAFSPRRLPQPCAEPWYGRGVHEVVTDPEEFRGRRIMIIGGGDSAFDWAHQLLDRAASVTLVHRSDKFRAHAATVSEVESAAAEGRAQVLTFHELADITSADDRLSGVVLKDIKGKTTRAVEVDAILPMLGFVSDLGAMTEWGLNIVDDEITVTSTMETSRPGIYAAGDITTYPGKLKLIATGFGEAAIAVNQAVHWIYPEKKVNPGHSSNLAIFGQKDD
jgi:ferredoxin/flavodoxin---NADP+ reductase